MWAICSSRIHWSCFKKQLATRHQNYEKDDFNGTNLSQPIPGKLWSRWVWCSPQRTNLMLVVFDLNHPKNHFFWFKFLKVYRPLYGTNDVFSLVIAPVAITIALSTHVIVRYWSVTLTLRYWLVLQHDNGLSQKIGIYGARYGTLVPHNTNRSSRMGFGRQYMWCYTPLNCTLLHNWAWDQQCLSLFIEI